MTVQVTVFGDPEREVCLISGCGSRVSSAEAWPETSAALKDLFGDHLTLRYYDLGDLALRTRFTGVVEGAQALTQDKVAELADARGQSIWLLDTKQVVDRLQGNAYIERASVSVALPDQLSIVVSERRPEVRWQSGSTRYLLDADGRVLDADETTPMSDTLVIEDRSNRLLKPNDMVDPDALKLSRVLSLRLPAELGLQPARITWDADNKIAVATADSRTIIFGTSDNLDSKLLVLGTLLKDQTPFTQLDLRPSTPFYRNDAAGAPAPVEAAETPTE